MKVLVINRDTKVVELEVTVSQEEIDIGYVDWMLKQYEGTKWYAVSVEREGQ